MVLKRCVKIEWVSNAWIRTLPIVTASRTVVYRRNWYMQAVMGITGLRDY